MISCSITSDRCREKVGFRVRWQRSDVHLTTEGDIAWIHIIQTWLNGVPVPVWRGCCVAPKKVFWRYTTPPSVCYEHLGCVKVFGQGCTSTCRNKENPFKAGYVFEKGSLFLFRFFLSPSWFCFRSISLYLILCSADDGWWSYNCITDCCHVCCCSSGEHWTEVLSIKFILLDHIIQRTPLCFFLLLQVPWPRPIFRQIHNQTTQDLG